MKLRLLQARNPGDIVREEERQAFAEKLGIPVDDVLGYDLLSQELTVDAVTDGVDGVLVGGSGEYAIYDDAPFIRPFVDLLGELCARRVPTFASCFGFQGLVVALGGRVGPGGDAGEVGSFQLERLEQAKADPVFRHLPDQFVAQQGHKDVAQVMPDSTVNMARSDQCPHQALRVVGAPVFATQFHPELSHLQNRQRFERYLELYEGVFGRAQAHKMLDDFVPSPEASDLLRHFADLLRRGALTSG